MAVTFTPGAGLDVPKKTVRACRVPPDPTGEPTDGILELQECGAMPVDLLALSAWLAAAGMTHVALESTGASGKPLYNLVAGKLTVGLVNAAHGPQVPGRKTAPADARGLAQRRRYGLRRASGIPPGEPRDWRALTRDRTTVVQEPSREGNRVQGVRERANSKLAAGAADIMGVSARASWAAGVEGRADPATRAALATRRRSQSPLLEQALTGRVRDPHRQLLAMPVAQSDGLDEPIEARSAEMMRRLAALRGHT